MTIPEYCEWRWLGVGLGWGQFTYCHAEESCPEPGFNGTFVGEVTHTLCMVGGELDSSKR